jgi:toxin LF subunit
MTSIRPSVGIRTPVAIHQRHATHGATASNVLAKITAGINAVRLCGKEHGMVLDHLQKLADFAEQHNIVFAIRPTNYLATQLIAHGFPTKGIEVKAKSADWGPMAGFIPVHQEFSKLNGNEKAIEEFVQDSSSGRAVHGSGPGE